VWTNKRIRLSAWTPSVHHVIYGLLCRQCWRYWKRAPAVIIFLRSAVAIRREQNPRYKADEEILLAQYGGTSLALPTTDQPSDVNTKIRLHAALTQTQLSTQPWSRLLEKKQYIPMLVHQFIRHMHQLRCAPYYLYKFNAISPHVRTAYAAVAWCDAYMHWPSGPTNVSLVSQPRKLLSSFCSSGLGLSYAK
jgi:hypothetical protein